MVCARPLVVVGFSVVLAACAGDVAWRRRPPVPQPPTRVIGGVAVATLCEDLPDLTEADVAFLVGRAEKEMQGLRVRRIVHSRTHPLETRYVGLQFEYHETHARIRRSRTVMFTWDDDEQGGVGRRAWSLEPERHWTQAEICAPGRSFLAETPIPEADVVRVGVRKDLTADEIVDVVDAVYNHVPAGQKLRSIRREDDGAFEVMTAWARKYRSLSGSVLEVRRGRWGWKVTLTGKWVS